jgi:glc operon protein GlcG
MKRDTWTVILLAASLLVAGDAKAQQTQPAGQNPLDVVPEKMPFNTPYGTPISLEKAQAAVLAAVAEANKRGWPLNVAVVDSGGNLVTFARMDGAQLASIAISEHKARVAAKSRRPTKAFEEAIQKGINILITLDDVIASRGGIPLIDDGKLSAQSAAPALPGPKTRSCVRQARLRSTDSWAILRRQRRAKSSG